MSNKYESIVPEVYIPDSEIIPTALRVNLGDIHIRYHRDENSFAYIFNVSNAKDVDDALEVVKRLTQVMSSQSYDHGAEWRETKTEYLEEGIWGHSFKVSFRIRDSY